MLNFTNVSLRRGTRTLIEDVNLTFHRNQCIGLTGANGTGKSSLLAMILGELQADAGELQLQGNVTIAHVAQETPALDKPALEYAIDGDVGLRELEQKIAHATESDNGSVLGNLMSELENIGGYDAESRGARLLNGLGFKQEDLQKPVCDFSGGWRMRLNLAQALMCRSDLLLLDEPTNHLDMDAILWLEQWIKQYTGTVLVISHDRDFLDAICSHIVHVEQRKAVLYTGNYEQFEIARAMKLSQQQSAYDKQQKDIAHLESFITRFKAKATKAKQAQSRIKTLERMQKLAPAHADSPFQFEFFKPKKPLQHLISFKDVSLGYDTPIVNGVHLNIINEQRIGLLGMNGAGKSTLIKTLAQSLPIHSGDATFHPDCVVGYFAQHQLEQLVETNTPLDHLFTLDKTLNPNAQKTEQEMRDYLGGFGFHGDRVNEAIKPFSGGEKARLALALLVFHKPNLLLLDEPTNHLDLDMRHALSMALQQFEGAVVIVSHDRHLLRSVCETLYIVHDGKAQEFDGSLDDYPTWLDEQIKLKQLPPQASDQDLKLAQTKKQQRQQDAERRKQLKPLQDAVKKQENQIQKLEEQLTEIETQLGDEALYTDETRKTELQDILKAQGELKKQLDDTELAWMEAQNALDQATIVE